MKMEKQSTSFLGLMAFVLTAMLTGCGGDGGGGMASTGSLGVSLTDAPACGFDEVNVTVDKVRVHQSGSANEHAAGWTTIAVVPPRKINLLDLNDPSQPNFALENLGVAPIGAGHYTQVRLVLLPNNGSHPTANSVVLTTNPPNTTEIALDTPSAIQSGVKMIHPFTVNQGERTDLVLDIDACKSIVKTGNNHYKLKPVIQIIPFQLNGIKGFVDPNLLSSLVVVSAQSGGTVVRSTVPNQTTGEFFLARLAPGSYDVVITASNSPTNTCCATAVISGVPVQHGTSITTISNQAQPFQLQPSGFHTIGDTVTLINPPPPPAVDDRDDATVIIDATQALSGGPTIVVNSQVATANDGAMPVGDYGYGLVLPIAAPSLAAFGALPIIPTAAAQGAVAGVYSVHGSAQTPTTVYNIQAPAPSSVNISAGDDLGQDFTLAP